VTSRLRIADYARRTIAHAERLGGPRVDVTLRELHARLVVAGRELGAGYGRVTPRAQAAIATWRGPRLDGVYSAKAAAALLRLHREGHGPLVFWSSKSGVVMPPVVPASLRDAPFAIRRWLRDSSREPFSAHR
jgi:hypothetical protein